jgi:hypothetical protein
LAQRVVLGLDDLHLRAIGVARRVVLLVEERDVGRG